MSVDLQSVLNTVWAEGVRAWLVYFPLRSGKLGKEGVTRGWEGEWRRWRVWRWVSGLALGNGAHTEKESHMKRQEKQSEIFHCLELTKRKSFTALLLKKKKSHKIPRGKHESYTATTQVSTLELAARAMSEERKFNGPHYGLFPFPSWLPPQSKPPSSESRGSNLKPASVKECRNSYLPSCSTSWVHLLEMKFKIHFQICYRKF